MELSNKYLNLVNECKKEIKENSIEGTYKILNYEKNVLIIDIREGREKEFQKQFIVVKEF